MAGHDNVDLIRRALEQPQRGEVVLNRVRGVVQVEQRDQDIGKQIASEEDSAFFDQQRCVARGMRLMLDDPD